jgi:hypothetical protein
VGMVQIARQVQHADRAGTGAIHADLYAGGPLGDL